MIKRLDFAWIYDKNTTKLFIKNQENTTSYDSMKKEKLFVFSMNFFNRGLVSGNLDKILLEWMEPTKILYVSSAFLQFFNEEDFHSNNNSTNLTNININAKNNTNGKKSNITNINEKFWKLDIFNFSDLIPMKVNLTEINCTLEIDNVTSVPARSYFKLFLLLSPRKPSDYRKMSFEIQILSEFSKKIKGVIFFIVNVKKN